MGNGKPGDNPLSDILFHGLPTYGSEVDALVREIDALEGPDGTALADKRVQKLIFEAAIDAAARDKLRARLLQLRAQLIAERD